MRSAALVVIALAALGASVAPLAAQTKAPAPKSGATAASCASGCLMRRT